jgi:DNA-binding MarR family transcriptional regulator
MDRQRELAGTPDEWTQHGKLRWIPIAWIARDLGANRQNVQRIINDLHTDGLVILEPNPHHRRAQLVVLTDKGKQAFESAMQLQAPWIDGLSEGLAVKELKTVHRVITALRKKLDGNAETDEGGDQAQFAWSLPNCAIFSGSCISEMRAGCFRR